MSWPNTANPFGVSGRLATQVNDTWFGNGGRAWNGKNISYSYYFVLVPQGVPLDSDAPPQATFTAIRTCNPFLNKLQQLTRSFVPRNHLS